MTYKRFIVHHRKWWQFWKPRQWVKITTLPGCAWCGALPIRDNLDGDDLCNARDQWARETAHRGRPVE